MRPQHPGTRALIRSRNWGPAVPMRVQGMAAGNWWDEIKAAVTRAPGDLGSIALWGPLWAPVRLAEEGATWAAQKAGIPWTPPKPAQATASVMQQAATHPAGWTATPPVPGTNPYTSPPGSAPSSDSTPWGVYAAIGGGILGVFAVASLIKAVKS